MGTANSILLVEGVSDQIAVETLAQRTGRDLAAEGVVILPMGGAQAVAGYLRRFGSQGDGLRLAGLCDAAEEEVFRRALVSAGLGEPASRGEMAHLGFHVCVDDLEDELVRAVGPDRVLELFSSQGDLGSFETLQKQPAWRGEPAAAQMRRFLGAGARRKLRYAKLLVATVPLERVPLPIAGALADV